MKNERARDIAAIAAAVLGSGVLALLLLRSHMSGMILGAVIGVALVPLVLSRPTWALLLFLAFPPGVLTVISGEANATLMILFTIIALAGLACVIGRRRIGDMPLAAGYGAFLALAGVSYFLQRVPEAVGASLQFVTFLFYGALYLIVVNMAPRDPAEGRAFVRAVHAAVLVSALATGAIALTQMGGSLLSGFSLLLYPEQPGLLYNRTHFGYLMALGLAVALPRWALRAGPSGLWGTISIICFGLVVLSLTRGGWGAALMMTILVAFASRRRGLLLAIPAGMALSLIPVIRERLLSDFTGGVLFALQSGAAGSYRVLLWQVLVPLALSSPWLGHGFGFMTTLAPELYFGENQFVTAQNPFLYAHNDFLYLVMELGLVGLAVYLVGILGWWARTISSLREALGRKDAEMLALILTCVGVGLVALVAQMADNAFFIRAVYERFAVVAATSWTLRSSLPKGPTASLGTEDA